LPAIYRVVCDARGKVRDSDGMTSAKENFAAKYGFRLMVGDRLNL
jgi:hypothetical protein